MMATHTTQLTRALDELRQLMWPSRSLTDADNVKLTPQEIHEYGLCNKARLHYECHGRDNYAECG
jgi:hypothetical protein